MKYLSEVLIIGAVLLLSACSGLTVEKAPLAQQHEAPEDARPAPVGFSKIRFAIPTGTPVRSYSPKGALGLLECGPPYGMEEGGTSSRSFPNDDSRRIFLDTLEGEGYDVAGDPGRMFDEEEDEMRAVYSVGARVTDVKMDLCRHTNIWGSHRGDSGEAVITVEWTVFDLLHRKNAYKTVTKGYAKQKLPNYETGPLLMEKAFEAAVHNLGADPEFHELVFNGTPPDRPLETVYDENEGAEDAMKFDPREAVPLPGQKISEKAAQGRLEDIRKSVVMIEAAGTHGSGFFITNDGHILTNAHVVGNATRVRVVTSGKKEKLIGEVLRLDRKRDVALVRLEQVPEGLAIKTLPVRAEKPNVGEEVYAIGAPELKRLEDTVTKGIVSAWRYDPKEKQDYIQADVDVYSGNSGGHLIDGHGNVIGMSALGWNIAPDTLGGLNWFIPIGDALKQLEITLP